MLKLFLRQKIYCQLTKIFFIKTCQIHERYATTEKGHGREEARLHIVNDVPNELIHFSFE